MQWEWFVDERAAGRRWSSVERRTRPAEHAGGGSRTTTGYEEQEARRRRRRLPPRPAGADEADEIQRLAELHASGALTDEEFAAAKAKILGI